MDQLQSTGQQSRTCIAKDSVIPRSLESSVSLLNTPKIATAAATRLPMIYMLEFRILEKKSVSE